MIRLPALDETETHVHEEIARRLGDGLSPSHSSKVDLTPAWMALSELGVLAVPLSEDKGGMGAGLSNGALVLEPLGRCGLVTPFLEAVCIPAAIAAMCGNLPVLDGFASTAAGGGDRAVLAWMEPDRGWARLPVDTRAVALDEGWRIDGYKTMVRWGASASAFIVTADVSSTPALFLVPSKSAGVDIAPFFAADGRDMAEVRLSGVTLPADARLTTPPAGDTIDFALDAGAALSLFEAVGAMTACLDMTIQYLKTREQFGMPLSKLQALQHRLVDMYVDCEEAWSLAHDAGTCLSAETPADMRAKTVSMAKAHIGRAGRRVAQEALQLHGAIGMTMEYPLGRLLTRLTLIDLDYGDSEWHLRRLEKLLQREHTP